MKEKQKNIRKYIFLYACFFIYSASAVCAKFASCQNSFRELVLFLALEISCLGLYAVLWQQVLKRFALVTAMANKGIVVIFNLIWSVILFSEMIDIYNIIGALFIIGGIWMVSVDG